ncbi:DUF3560 domain-containing protein [Photobacterium damselae]|uniref:DUF3560 domain-containing protein n=1 Tax=Photobacterium damselae TaxID=38293 RepID=UPI004069760D
MTHSTDPHSTISNQLAATQGVALSTQGSPKNDILKSLKAGHLRKNAKVKIAQLVQAATSIEIHTQSMGMDDCWNANEPRSMSVEEFWAWYEAEYKDMNIRVECQDGVVNKVRFSDCIYHFSTDVYLTFDKVATDDAPQKIRLTYQQVKQALRDGYLSPLNSTEKRPTPPEDNQGSRKVVSLGDYQDRVDAKRERLEHRAEKASQDSDRYYQSSKSLAKSIPFGQPILVGHHSEAKARRHADKIYNDMGKSVQAAKKAEHYERKADSVGTAGIASDDPEAIQKLKKKVDALEQAQEKMKAANKIIRSKHMTEADKVEYMIQTLAFTSKQAQELLLPDDCGRIGFADYALSNNNANIRQAKARLRELETLHNQKPFEEEGLLDGMGWSLYEDDGRIKFSFDGKPSEAVRAVLKGHGFKWSRYSMAWVRKITPNAVHATHRVLESLRA